MSAILTFIKSLWLPISIVVGYLLFGLLLRQFFPTVTAAYLQFEQLFRQYGYYIILIGAVLESALIIDLFVPGGSIILAGAYFTSQGVISYPIFLLVVLIGTIIGFSIDYAVGYFGWSSILQRAGLGKQLQKAQNRLDRLGGRAYFLGYIHPDIGSFYAVASGILKISPKKFWFYSIPSLVFWIVFWTLPIYFFGEIFKKYTSQYQLIGLILIIIVFVLPRVAKSLSKKEEVSEARG